MLFPSRADFRAWLEENYASEDGVWLVFGKGSGPKTLKAGEALEEALCFGWIDGQMQSVNDESYVKYFKQRSRKSEWSAKNVALAADLERRGLMREPGREKIARAKADGLFTPKAREPVTEEEVAAFAALLEGEKEALRNFISMSPSVRRSYVGSYRATKTEEGKRKRLAVIIKRLRENLKPM